MTMSNYHFYITRVVVSPAKATEIIGYEVYMLEDAVIMKLPGATYELGVIDVEKVQGREGSYYILTPIELMMNLMNEGFKVPIEDKRGRKHIMSLLLPPPEEIKTVLPRYKVYCETGEITTVPPYKIIEGEVYWEEPEERYKGMYEGMYKARIELGDKIQELNALDLKQMKMGLIYSLQKQREQEIKGVAIQKAKLKQANK